ADPQPVTVQGGAADHFTELVFHGVLPVEDDEDHATGTVDPVADTADEEQAPESAVADAATAPGSADVEDRNTTRDGDKGRSTTAVGGDGVVTPMAVPSPGSGAAVITVKVGDRRASGSAPTDSSVTGLPGVTLRLLTDNNGNPGQPVNQPWATCQSDPDGDCSFVVPNTGSGGENRDKRFWVELVAVPNGYYANTTLVTSTNGSSFSTSSYRFRTGNQLRSGQVYRSTND